jgi:tetratricopeptide (TPR) repeat protein
MMKRACVIRVWIPAILLGGVALAASFAGLEAQTSQPGTQASPVGVQAPSQSTLPVTAVTQVPASTTQTIAPATQALLDMAYGFEARGRMDLAEQTWQHVLQTDPYNADALGGLARAAKQAGNTALAASYLERLRAAQAMKSPPGGNEAAGIQPAVQAQPVAQVAPAAQAQPAGQAKAAVLAQSTSGVAAAAPATAGTESATEAEANAALNANHLDQAEALFRAILEKEPNNARALAGMGYIRMQQGNFLGAISFLEEARQGDANDKGVADALETARFRFLMGEGQSALNDDDLTMAEKQYRAALQLRPSSGEALTALAGTLEKAVAEQTAAGQKPSADVEMQLAWINVERGNSRLAVPIYQKILTDDPSRADAWGELLIAMHAAGSDKEAVKQMQQIPAAALVQLENNGNTLQAMASVYQAVGQSQQALVLLNRVQQYYAAQHTSAPADIDIQSAWMMYNSEDDVDLYRQLMDLRGRSDLSTEQTRTVQAIWTNWAVRRANKTAAAGNLKRALAILNAASRAFPDNPAVLKTLANGYAQAGKPKKAVIMYKAQNMSSGSVEEYQAAVSAALAAGDNKAAKTWLHFAMAAFPNDPRVLILRARIEQARESTAKAIDYYRASLKAMPAEEPGAKPAADLRLGAPTAASRLPDAQQAQELSILLAPENNGYMPNAQGQPYLSNYGYSGTAYPAAPAQTNSVPNGPGVPSGAVPPQITNPGMQPDSAGKGNLDPNGAPYPLPPLPLYGELMERNLTLSGGTYVTQAPSAMTPRQEAESELASLEGSYSGWWGGTAIGRYRSGTPGLDQLIDVEAPAEISAEFGRSARLTEVALPVFLDSGTLNAAAITGSNVPYLGTMPANSANPPAQQQSYGIGGELQLTTKYIGLAAGYTPYNFLIQNITGHLSLRLFGGHLAIHGDRDPVKDTQLSYAGLRDPATITPLTIGKGWGGVVSSTGGARLDVGSGGSGFYLSGGGGILHGYHVLNNTKYEASIGAYLRAKKWPTVGSLTLGASLFAMNYQRDEIGLSWGQGGYFSPNTYFLASVPVSFHGAYKSSLHYLVSGALGMHTYRQDWEYYYPLDPGLQANLQATLGCSVAQLAAHTCAEYPVSSNRGFNYDVNSEASYRFGEHWYLGGFVSANNSNNYNTVSGGFFFRYAMHRQHASEGYPTGLFPVDSFRPLRVP